MQSREVVIVSAVRTPIGYYKGISQHCRSDELLAIVLREVIERARVDPSVVDDCIVGCANHVREQGGNIARTGLLMAGYPVEVPGITVQRQCGSAESALHIGSQAILSGDMSCVVVAGVESMSRIPLGSARGDTPWHPWLTDRYEMVNQGIAAERIAAHWGLSREELDEFSLQSHMKAIQAQDQRLFAPEIVPVKVRLPDGEEQVWSVDDGPRRDTSREKIAKLKPVFDPNGVITPANSSQMSNGAAAVLLMEREQAKRLGLRPRASITHRVVIGDDPTMMLTGPIKATKKIMEKSGLRLSDMDAIEINEAFASVVLAWAKECEADMSRVNPRGGAISLGHPTGCSGARLLVTLLHELEQTGGRMGLQTMCHGGGTATATIIEIHD